MTKEFVSWEQEREIIKHLEKWLKDRPESLATIPYRDHVKHHKHNVWKRCSKE